MKPPPHRAGPISRSPPAASPRRGERPEGAGWPPGPGARPGREPAGWALGCHSADLQLRAAASLACIFYIVRPWLLAFSEGLSKLCGCAACGVQWTRAQTHARQHAEPGDLPRFLTHSLEAGAFQAGLTVLGRLPESSAALSTLACLPPAA